MTSLLEAAISTDESGDARRACELYEQAIEALLARGQSLDGQAKQQNSERVASCLDRAEVLKAQLRAGSSISARASAPRSGVVSTILFVKAPPCSFLGDGRKAIVLSGPVHRHNFSLPNVDNGRQELHGLYSELTVGLARDAAEFVVEGDMATGCTIRRKSDPRMWLENDHDRRNAGTRIMCWGCIEHDWCKRYVFNGDGTVSPTPNPHDVVLGVQREDHQAKVVFVPRDDQQRRIIVGGAAETEAHFEQLRREATARRAAMQRLVTDATSRLSPAFRDAFHENGFTHLSGLITPDLVRAAKAEINRQLGQSANTDQFKAKMFPKHPAILSLVKDSAVPAVLAELIGGDADFYCARLSSGQIALRFPGDMCHAGAVPGTPDTTVPPAHFDAVRRAWHIDGCPNNFLPGTTDHFGTIHNFDCLVGVLLSDVPQPMSGELVCYPGSHLELAHYFGERRERLEEVRHHGKLPTGDETDKLFRRPVHHCIGKAGDVFLANYMTAHLIAPNISADIRYAVYFRVSGPRFEEGKAAKGGNAQAMLDPWVSWQGVGGAGDRDSGAHLRLGGADVLGVQPASVKPDASTTLDEEVCQRELEMYMEIADNARLQQTQMKSMTGGQTGSGSGVVAGTCRGGAVLEAMSEMFPALTPDVLADALAACGGDAELAAERLLAHGP